MIRMCICDDNKDDMERLRKLTQSFSKEHPEFPIKIEEFKSADNLLDSINQFGGFDIYLLDVVMPDMDGVELAKRIRDRGEAAEILFLTMSREYAVEAFRVRASNYLMKPIRKREFDRELLTCIRHLAPEENPSLLLKTKSGVRKVCIQELMMVESFNHRRICTLVDGATVETSATLVSLYEALQAYSCFFMPHRAYIIHLHYVKGLSALEVLLNNGKRIPVSRNAYADLKTALLDYSIPTNEN